MDLNREELQAFNPRASEYRFKLWVRVVTPDGAYRHVFWARIGVVAAAMLLAAWLAITGAAWAFLRYQRDWQSVSYLDLVLYPLRAREFRAALGQHYIQVGRGYADQKNFQQAHAFLMAGLRHAPENLEARKTAAIMLARFGLVPRALDTLAGGVGYNPDLEYLKLMFGWLLEARQDDEVLSLARQLLPAKPDAVLKHRFVALQAAIAHHELGRYDTAEQLILDWGLVDALEGQLVIAACDWQRGLREKALQRLEGELARFAQRDELHVQIIRYCRELGRHADARRHALLRQFNDPRSPGPRIDVLHGYRSTDDAAGEAREVERFLQEFGSDVRALTLLAGYATDAVRPQLLARVCALAEEQKFPRDDFDLARVQLALIERDYASALHYSEPKRLESAGGGRRVPKLIDALRAVALYAGGQVAEADGAIAHVLSSAQLRAYEARIAARELKAVGALKLSRLLLERLVEKSSTQDPQVIAEIIRLDIATGNRAGLVQYLTRFLAMRRPARDALEEVMLALDERSDAELVARVRESLQAAAAVRRSEG